jgi:hypothetical protein
MDRSHCFGSLRHLSQQTKPATEPTNSARRLRSRRPGLEQRPSDDFNRRGTCFIFVGFTRISGGELRWFLCIFAMRKLTQTEIFSDRTQAWMRQNIAHSLSGRPMLLHIVISDERHGWRA